MYPTLSYAAQTLERERRRALTFAASWLIMAGMSIYIFQTRSPRLREAGTGGDLGLTAMGWQGQGSHGYLLRDVSHTGEWAIWTVVAVNMSDPY